MVLGFYLSLDPPGAAGTGLALAQAILPKESWLAKRGISNNWPCCGIPAMVHGDNAPEFRGEMVRRACQQYGIEADFRPVATPHYGGHIERSLGTLAKAIHELPGTTFSNPQHRGDYDSEGTAALTLSELEKYIAEYITGVYHNRYHHGIKSPPIKRWTDGILGSASQAGSGFDLPDDEERFRFDFMPLEERTIQNYGIQIDKINYYSDALRPYINEEIGHTKRKFIFRRDPGDISTVYFWEPTLEEYVPVPYRLVGRSAMTLWELRAVRKRLEEEGRKAVDEVAIFDSYERLRRLREAATSETKKVRRARAREQNRQKTSTPKDSEASNPANVIPFPLIARPFEVERG
jgi:putative transposase